MEYILKTERLSKVYGSYKAVNEVNMKIKKGDIYGFIGKNGAGKTSFIRLITGLIRVSDGEYELFGNKNTNASELVKRRVAAVVETPSIYLNMNAYDNLVMQCKVLGIVDEKMIEEILKIVGLSTSKKDSKLSKNYSLGMRQRLGLAIALIGNPDFIILDEPTNGLDPEGIIEIRELIIKLNKEKNITFLISSHILGELSKFATCYGFIHEGKLIQEIEAKELLEKCQRSTKIKVNDAQVVVPLLEKLLKIQNYKIVNNQEIIIYDDIENVKIISSLSKEGFDVLDISNQKEDLEGYYINLIGGNHVC